VELDERVRPALEELAQRAQHEDVVVVSHVSPIKSAVTWALGVGPDATWRCHLDRASICRIAVSSRGPALTSLNETAHLL
jgi:broad specificity phosphatase PhoE